MDVSRIIAYANDVIVRMNKVNKYKKALNNILVAYMDATGKNNADNVLMYELCVFEVKHLGECGNGLKMLQALFRDYNFPSMIGVRKMYEIIDNDEELKKLREQFVKVMKEEMEK